MARLFVLDAMNLTYRAYHALLTRDRTDPTKWVPLRNSRGEATNALLGFANTVLKIRREEKPDYWVLAWDGPGPTFRHQRYPDYKATRKPIPDDLLAQIEPIERMAQALGLPLIEIPGMEADDVMASLACRGERDGLEVVLVTGDKDLVQVVSDRVKILAPLRRGEDYAWIDREAVIRKWSVPPERVVDVLALLGDTIDNIPGVPGIGEKTAAELLKEFGSLDGIYANLERVKKPALRARLEAHRAQAYLSRELVTVKTDCELPYGWDELRVLPIRRDAMRELTRRYEMGGLERRVMELAVADEDAGTMARGRTAVRRGTASETPAPGVRLTPTDRERESAGGRADGEGTGGPPVAADTALHDPETRRTEPEAIDAGRPEEREIDALPESHTRPAAGGQTILDLWSAPAVEAAAAAATQDLDRLARQVEEVRARAAHGLAVFPVRSGDDPRTASLVGIALAARDGTACYLPIAHAGGLQVGIAEARAWLAPALGDPAVPKLGVDLKSDAHLLARAGLTLDGLWFDAHIGSFLCDPEREHDLRAIARDFLGVELPPLGTPALRGRPRPDPGSAPVAEIAAAAAAAAAVLHPLADRMRAELESREQWTLYQDLEHPLISVLLDMERSGVLVDRAALAEMSVRAGEEIERLRRELFAVAGEEVNLESGAQVAKVLFEKLGLKPRGRTPGGALSTRQDVLEELAPAHPFARLLLEYRALTKLASTYLDALPQVIDPVDQRVHTSFNQAGAATGRLSSSDPNLQNIPMRTAQGRAIRRAFIAAPGAVLVGADYSQIELRVMAHLSGDPRLIEAFETGQDVHAATARQIFGSRSNVLDPELRSRAKVVNFGIMYGMGARSLAQQMGIGLAEAQDFIRSYFRVFARVREFIDGTLEEARRRGYVQTLLGRRRYLPGLQSGHGGERSFAERAAINTPLQGSAADLMKLAMIRVHGVLKQRGTSARLLLQVHDELLLECPAGEAEAVSEMVRAEMEGCYTLRVPLIVSLGRGPTWFDVH